MNKIVLTFIFAVFLITMSGFALADYQIESVDFMVGSQEVTHILPQKAQIVDIVINTNCDGGEKIKATIASSGDAGNMV